ncbi:PD-(D/E)XK nuclease family transposase [Candidatus Rhabdochlamydia sp. T3358]|uniref:PD-(D/E)XK nuclease family transposase n=1 Tax=Candidatus Rhabdochlamydia sp. T3358 TaxID=2099795 RepID=UPI003312F8F9
MAFFRYLDPKNDIAFKKIFGSEKNKDILIHFLNDILGSFKKNPIVDKAILEYKVDEGIAIGIEKGKIELAKRLLQNKVGMDVIALSADLSKEQIEELQKCILDGTTAVNF